MYDCLKGSAPFEIVERDAGYYDASDGRVYLSAYDQWPRIQKETMKHAHGRVLDMGCGAGRHSIYLQNMGLEVVGIDISPLAVETCKLRGLRDARVMSIEEVTPQLGTFDTFLMLGNNFGLLRSRASAGRLLRRLLAVTSEKGIIIAESMDPHKTENPDHLAYHKRNERRGRMPGHVRIRMRYRKYVNPWFDCLFASNDEMREVIQGSGWEICQFVEGQGPAYVALITKAQMVRK